MRTFATTITILAAAVAMFEYSCTCNTILSQEECLTTAIDTFPRLACLQWSRRSAANPPDC
jgi:hypothetical protein